ncbi:MAG TPA: DUF488 domain-containing protein [Eoetvoesiella sp.]
MSSPVNTENRQASTVAEPGGTTIWTVGHSTRPLDAFLALLIEYGIEAIADVRSFPGSRKYPQYGKEKLAATLSDYGIGYAWHPLLGGRRRVNPSSPNTAWRNASFRSYADYMSTSEFSQGLEGLIDAAGRARTALMCAEAVWWRCHRSMVSDALCVRGIRVVHIMDVKHSAVHPMTSPARIVKGRLTYVQP